MSGSTFVRRAGLQAVEMDGETVMMGLDLGEYYALRGTAATLWAHLAEPSTIEVLCERVAAEYEVDVATCRPDVEAFLDDLTARGLVEVGRV